MSTRSGSVVVYGPSGCGKTRNAQRIAKHFGLVRVVDGWDGATPVPHMSLVLTNAVPPFGAPGVRVVAYWDIPAEVRA